MSQESVKKMSKEVMYTDPDGPTPEKAKFGVPDRWMRCPRKGKVIANKFIPFKTPLCSLYDDQVWYQNCVLSFPFSFLYLAKCWAKSSPNKTTKPNVHNT